MDFFTLKKMLKDRVICNRNKISFEREKWRRKEEERRGGDGGRREDSTESELGMARV